MIALESKQLSPRELEVLLLIAYENTNEEISTELSLSKGTIATYRNNILSKLSAKNTAGLLRKAFESELLVLDKKKKLVLSNRIKARIKSNK